MIKVDDAAARRKYVEDEPSETILRGVTVCVFQSAAARRRRGGQVGHRDA